jgi:hypothetical protein
VGTGGCDLKIMELSRRSLKRDAERNEIAAAEFDARRGIGEHNVAISDFRDGKFARCHADAGDRSDRFA